MPKSLGNGQRSPRKLLRAVIARLLGRKPWMARGGHLRILRLHGRSAGGLGHPVGDIARRGRSWYYDRQLGGHHR
jgi:hypothetical protein